LFDIHIFLLNRRICLSVIDDASKEQVLVALTVALGKHILGNHVCCKLCPLAIRKFHLIRPSIKDWVGVSLAPQSSVGLALPSANLGVHHFVPYWEHNWKDTLTHGAKMDPAAATWLCPLPLT
jgi:hypothetical protein